MAGTKSGRYIPERHPAPELFLQRRLDRRPAPGAGESTRDFPRGMALAPPNTILQLTAPLYKPLHADGGALLEGFD